MSLGRVQNSFGIVLRRSPRTSGVFRIEIRVIPRVNKLPCRGRSDCESFQSSKRMHIEIEVAIHSGNIDIKTGQI